MAFKILLFYDVLSGQPARAPQNRLLYVLAGHKRPEIMFKELFIIYTGKKCVYVSLLLILGNDQLA